MSCFSSLLSCCLPSKFIKPTPKPETAYCQTSTTNNPSPNPIPIPNHNINTLEANPPQDGYNQIAPLPAYTPRPMSVQEKTLEAHMRDPSISNETYHHHHHHHNNNNTQIPLTTDEKQRLAWEEATNFPDYYPYYSHQRSEEVSSDASSAFSFPSSYGNTSTATRETPPPPYSPRVLSPAPSRSMSISSAYRNSQMQMAPITQPPPVFTRPDAGRPSRRSIDEQLASTTSAPTTRLTRASWESETRYSQS
ncbi:hypothetical protein BJX76DRAFT_337492 [Aspergillus varians]